VIGHDDSRALLRGRLEKRLDEKYRGGLQRGEYDRKKHRPDKREFDYWRCALIASEHAPKARHDASSLANDPHRSLTPAETTRPCCPTKL